MTAQNIGKFVDYDMMCRSPEGLRQPRTRFPSDSDLFYQKLSNRVKGKKSPNGDFFYPYPLCHSAERRNLVVSFVTTRPRVKSPTKNAMLFSWGPIPRGDGYTNHLHPSRHTAPRLHLPLTLLYHGGFDKGQVFFDAVDV